MQTWSCTRRRVSGQLALAADQSTKDIYRWSQSEAKHLAEDWYHLLQGLFYSKRRNGSPRRSHRLMEQGTNQGLQRPRQQSISGLVLGAAVTFLNVASLASSSNLSDARS